MKNRHGLRFALVVLLAGAVCPAWAQLRQTPTGPPPKPEAPPTLQPLPKENTETDWQAFERIRLANLDVLRRYYLPPFSQIASDTANVYSRNVNRITCAVTVPAGAKGDGAEETWLGTRLGIKRTLTGKGVLRHYTMQDGLPGDQVQDLAADPSGAVALVRTQEGLTALAWWDSRADTWRTVAQLPPLSSQRAQQYDETTRWRCVLTPTRVLLVPPLLSLPGGNGLESAISVWRRDNLQAGQLAPHFVRWDDSLRDPSQNPYALTAGIEGAAAIGETLFVGSRIGLIAVPDATLFDDAVAPGFLSSAPRMPRFWAQSTVSSLAARDGKLWLTAASEQGNQPVQFVTLTPVIQDRLLVGVRTEAIPLPSLPPDSSEPVRLERGRIVPTSDGPWLLLGNSLLYYTGTRWERRDGDGVPIALDAIIPRPDAFENDYLNGIRPSPRPITAPPASVLPDAVVQARVLETYDNAVWEGDLRWDIDSRGIARQVAWIRQRLPHYYSSPADPPRLSNTTDRLSALLPDKAPLSGPAWSFFRDPFLPDTVWHSQEYLQTGTSLLWQLPSALVPPARLEVQQAYMNHPTFEPIVGPIAPSVAKAIPLPALPTRAHLPVKGMGVRADGLYVACGAGVLFIPTASLDGRGDKAAAARWVPQQTDKGIVPKQPGFDGLFQGAANSPLILDQFSRNRAALTYDAATKRFVPIRPLPPGQVLFASNAGVVVRPTQTAVTGKGTGTTGDMNLRFVPLRPDGTADAAGALALPGKLYTPRPNFPFLYEVYQPIAFSGGKLWYVGNISKPDKPRYQHDGSYYAIAGYDLKQKRWTAPREIPGDWQYGSPEKPILFEEGTTLFAAFNAPDGILWQYEPAQDTWKAAGPPLPAPAPGAALPNASVRSPAPAQPASLKPVAPRVWSRQGGETWLLFQGAVYRHQPGGANWTRFDAAPVLSTLRGDVSGAYQLAAVGDGLFVGGETGLWRFDKTAQTWTEIAPLASSLPDTPVSLPAYSYAADRDQLYFAGPVLVKDISPSAERFLLSYDRKGGWQSLTPEQLQLPRFTFRSRVWSDGLTVWLTDGAETRRRDPATGNWQIIPPLTLRTIPGPRGAFDSFAEFGKIVADPSAPGSPYLSNANIIVRYDLASGQLVPLLGRPDLFDRTEQDAKKHLPFNAQIRDLFGYRDGLIAVTTQGQYRINVRERTVERLPLPILRNVVSALQNDTSLAAEDGTYLWDLDTIIRLPR